MSEMSKTVLEQRRVSEEAVTHIISRLKWATTVFLIATFSLVVGLVYTLYGIESVENRITAVEASPCVVDVEGPECQAIFSKAFRGQSLDQSCVGLEKALTPFALDTFTICE